MSKSIWDREQVDMTYGEDGESEVGGYKVLQELVESVETTQDGDWMICIKNDEEHVIALDRFLVLKFDGKFLVFE